MVIHSNLKPGKTTNSMIEEKSLNLEKTVLVGIINSSQDEVKSKEYLDELEFLVHTAGGVVLKRFIQKLKIYNC